MDGIWLLFSFAIGAVVAWYFTSEHYKEINKHLTTTNEALKDQLFNINEAKQIYDQLRLLIPRTKNPSKKRKR